MDPQVAPTHGLNDLDYSVLGILLVSGIFALFRGFLREAFSLAAWVCAYFAAAKYYQVAEPVVSRYIKNDTAAQAVAAVAVFCAVFLAITLVGFGVSRLLRGGALTAIDRSLGFVFGVLRGALLVCLVYMAAVIIWYPDIDKPVEQQDKDRNVPPDWLQNAKTRPAMAYGSNILKGFLPDKMIEDTVKEYDAQKAKAQEMIDQKALDIMSTPTPMPAKPSTPDYDDKSRSNLDQLINQQKDKP